MLGVREWKAKWQNNMEHEMEAEGPQGLHNRVISIAILEAENTDRFVAYAVLATS